MLRYLSEIGLGSIEELAFCGDDPFEQLAKIEINAIRKINILQVDLWFITTPIL
jgi:hypothetical protein